MKKLTFVFLFILGIALVLWNMMKPRPSEVSEDLSRTETSLKTGQSESIQNVPNPKSTANTKNKSAEYQNQFESYFKSLPIMDDLRNLSEDEVHHTPEIISDGGELIGRIHEEAEKDSTKRSDAMSFFKKCVEDQHIVTAIRAVCLNKIYKLVPEWQIPAPLSESEISKDVLELALKIP